MPLDSVRHSIPIPGQNVYSYDELDYEFCHDEHMVAVSFEHLELASDLTVFVKDKLKGLQREPAEYICTLDWPNDNYLQHFIKLVNNGQFAVVPNHKILVNQPMAELPKYLKLRHRRD
jgi:hypothetical protein